jgi:hypothetical protein
MWNILLTEHKLFASFLHVNPISQILVINMYTEADSMIDWLIIA